MIGINVDIQNDTVIKDDDVFDFVFVEENTFPV